MRNAKKGVAALTALTVAAAGAKTVSARRSAASLACSIAGLFTGSIDIVRLCT